MVLNKKKDYLIKAIKVAIVIGVYMTFGVLHDMAMKGNNRFFFRAYVVTYYLQVAAIIYYAYKSRVWMLLSNPYSFILGLIIFLLIGKGLGNNGLVKDYSVSFINYIMNPLLGKTSLINYGSTVVDVLAFIFFFFVIYNISTFFIILMRRIEVNHLSEDDINMIKSVEKQISKRYRIPKDIKYYKLREDGSFATLGKSIFLSEEEITNPGVIAHEISHIYHKDVTTSNIILVILGIIRTIMNAIMQFLSFGMDAGNSKNKKADSGGLFFSLLMLFFGILFFIINIVLSLTSFFAGIIFGKIMEKRADIFAVKNGYGQSLKDSMAAYAKEDDRNWFQITFLDEHPDPRKRVIYIDEAMKKFNKKNPNEVIEVFERKETSISEEDENVEYDESAEHDDSDNIPKAAFTERRNKE